MTLLLPPGDKLQPGGETAVDWSPPGYRHDPAAPLILLITDASVSHQTGVAAWAAWAGCGPRDRLWTGTVSADESTDSSHAELCAIGHGLARVFRWLDPRPGAFVFVKSDSMAALNWVADQRAPNSTASIEAVAEIHELLTLRSIAIRCRHVRAHQTGPESHPIQDWVDHQAQAARRRIEAGLSCAKAP
jgi:hypothetical protein